MTKRLVPRGGSRTTTTVEVSPRVHCPSSAAAVSKELLAVAGVMEARAAADTGEVTVTYRPDLVDLARVRRVLQGPGANRGPVPGRAGDDDEAAVEYRRLMRKWWFGAAVGVPTMFLSCPWLLPGLRELFPRGSTEIRLLWAVMGAFSLAVMVYSGSQFFVGASAALRQRQANMHTLIAVGTGVAWVYSTIAVLTPQIFSDENITEVYYDVTVVVTALVVLGLAMEVKARGPVVGGDPQAHRPAGQDRARGA